MARGRRTRGARRPRLRASTPPRHPQGPHSSATCWRTGKPCPRRRHLNPQGRLDPCRGPGRSSPIGPCISSHRRRLIHDDAAPRHPELAPHARPPTQRHNSLDARGSPIALPHRFLKVILRKQLVRLKRNALNWHPCCPREELNRVVRHVHKIREFAKPTDDRRGREGSAVSKANKVLRPGASSPLVEATKFDQAVNMCRGYQLSLPGWPRSRKIDAVGRDKRIAVAAEDYCSDDDECGKKTRLRKHEISEATVSQFLRAQV